MTAALKELSASLLPRLLTSKNRIRFPARRVGGLQELNVGHVFDHAARIARREIDVLNARVGGIGGIKLPSDPAGQMLVSARLAKRLTAEGGLGLGDFEMRDSRLSLGRHGGDGSQADRKASEPTHCNPLHLRFPRGG